MDPILVHIGPLAIRWYGFLIALSVLIGALWALRLAERRGLDPDKLLDSAVWLVLAGIVGARLVYVVTSPAAFFGPGGHPLDAFKVWQGGISIHGGILGVLVAMYFYGRARHINMWSYMDVLTPLGALGIMGGRIGNIMNGTDTGGRLTDWAIGIDWPKPGTPFLGPVGRFLFGKDLWQFAPPACNTVPPGQPCHIHFAQAYGFLVGFIVLFIVVWALRHSREPGYAFWQFALWYSILRSLIEEPFRDNPLFWKVYDNVHAGVGFFTLTQLVSIPIVILAIVMLRNIRARQREGPARSAVERS